MSLFNDIKYASMLAPYLNLFTRKKDNVWNFRCPCCGDSKKNPSKKRGFIYRPTNKNYLAYKCYNCPASYTLGQFIQIINPELYKDYLYDAYLEKNDVLEKKPYSPEVLPELFQEMELKDSILDSLQCLSDLSETHPAVKYALHRKIPRELHNLLYFTKKFKTYVNSIIPNKFSSVADDHPRLIIPYFNKHGKCFAFQGRAFGKELPKYFTIKITPHERIYGLERVDYSKRIIAVEGPIDSLFLPNAIAVSGSSFDGDIIQSLKSNIILVFDNERRSPQIMKLLKKMIDKEFSVCMWPDTFVHKDINDAIIGGLTQKQIYDIINSNVYKGLSAKLRYCNYQRL